MLCGRGAAPLLPLMIRDGAVGDGGAPAGSRALLPVAAHRGDGRVQAAFNTALAPGRPENRSTGPGKGCMRARMRGLLFGPVARNRGSELLENVLWRA